MGWLKKLLLWGGGLALALTLLLMAWNEVGEVAMEQRVESVRAQGLPASPEELENWYPEPPNEKEESPAATYEPALALMDKKPGDPPLVDDYGLLPNRPLSSHDLEPLRRFLGEREDILAVLREGSTRGFARYPLDLKQPGGPLLPHLPKIRDAVRLLGLDALVRADDGDTTGAVESLMAAVNLCESLSDEPTLISQLVRCACHVTAIDYTARVLSASEPDATQLETLQKAFAEAERRDTFYRGLVGEWALALPYFRDYESMFRSRGAFMPPAQRFGLLKVMPMGFRERDYDYFTDRMTALIDAARGSIARRRAAMDDDSGERPPWYCIGSTVLLQGTNALGANLRDFAYLRCAQTALAIERYRADGGVLPEALADLAPGYLSAVPLDPFTDAPLVYRPSDTGFMVYSLGLDRDDDGGIDFATREESRDKRDLDFTVRVSLPEIPQ